MTSPQVYKKLKILEINAKERIIGGRSHRNIANLYSPYLSLLITIPLVSISMCLVLFGEEDKYHMVSLI